MQEDARDSLEVFKFNLIEETIGRWLRAVIQRLEEERSGIRRNHNDEPSESGKIKRRGPLVVFGRMFSFSKTKLHRHQHSLCALMTKKTL